MALMNFREPNQVKWVGSRPGHNGEQITAAKTSIATAWDDVYTVSAGKTLYLCTLRHSHYSNTISKFYHIAWTDAGHGVQVRFVYDVNKVTGMNSDVIHFWPPLEIPAGHKIAMYVADATNRIFCFIYGWEE